MMRNFNYKRGQALVEIILAMAIFGLMAASLASMALGGFRGLEQGGEQTVAAMWAQEGIEAVRAIRDRAWNELIYAQSGVATDGTKWMFSGEATTDSFDQYTRTISFGDVCRDMNDDLVSCPGDYVDINSKLLIVTVDWAIRPGVVNSVQRGFNLTNWSGMDWIQTDWSGGSGQTAWSDDSKYDEATNIDDSVGGQISLSLTSGTSGGLWVSGGGSEATDTTDGDFNQGSFDNTVVDGSGEVAGVVLEQELAWREHPDSQVETNQRLRDVFALAINDAWAVGNSGKILHYNGSDWAEHSDTGGEVFYALEMLSATNGWAVTGGGTIFNYNGSTWSLHSNLGNQSILDIDMISTSDGWAVGGKGKIYRYNNGSWSEFVDTGNQDWESVNMVSGSDGWVVGSGGEIRRWNGSNWANVSSPTSDTLMSVQMVTSTDGWAVGINGTIINYNGTSWSTATSPTVNILNEVDMISANEGWAVGNSGVIIYYDGNNWVLAASPTTNYIEAVSMVDSNHGWAVGDGGRIFEYNQFYKDSGIFYSRIIDSLDSNTTWDKTFWFQQLPSGADITAATRTGNTAIPDGSWSTWSSELTDEQGSVISSPDGQYLQYRLSLTKGDLDNETPRLDEITIIYNSIEIAENLNSLDVLITGNIWSVGDGGRIINFDNVEWQIVSSPTTENLYGVDMLATDNGWAVGANGMIINYDGVSWTTVSSPVSTDLNDVMMLSGSQGWVVGNDGKILNYDGNSWSEQADMGARNISDLYMVSSSLGWAVGQNGEIYNYDGNSWSLFSDVGGQDLGGIYMVSDTDGWVVANNGLIYKYENNNWTQDTDTGNMNWRAVYFYTNLGWTVGSGGQIYQYYNNTWESETSPTGEQLNDIVMTSSRSGWAVGNNGTIIHRTGLYAFNLDGWLISSALDMGDESPVQTIEWDEIVPVCSPVCEIRFQVRTAPDSGGSPGSWSAWYGESGPVSYFSNDRGSLISQDLNGNQWVQYQVFLYGDGNHSPVLEEIRISYK